MKRNFYLDSSSRLTDLFLCNDFNKAGFKWDEWMNERQTDEFSFAHF